MGAKFDVDSDVLIKGRVVSVTTDETGTVYQVKFRAQNKMVTTFLEEEDVLPVDPEPTPEPIPIPTKDKCAVVTVSGTVIKDTVITLACATAGATIKYSVNDGEYAAYADGITVSENMTIKAYASADGYDDSDVSTFTYTVTEPEPEPTPTKCAAVTASVASGEITKDTVVTLACETAGATIKYSVNDGGFEAYVTGITVSENMTIKAYASADGYEDGDVAIFTYTVVEP